MNHFPNQITFLLAPISLLFLLLPVISIPAESAYGRVLLVQGVAGAGTGRPAAELEKAVRAVRESYYYPVDGRDVDALPKTSLEDLVNALDKDSGIVDRSPSSLEFVRGLRPEDSVAKAELIEKGLDYIGYIRIKFFGRRTGPDFKKRMGDLGDMSGLIIDLRDNPGGHLQGALEVLGSFVPAGGLLLTEVRRDGREQYFSHTKVLPTLTEDVPVVVLINSSTASSAEIVAATLRYYKNAVIVGQKSHAKGTVQKVIPLSANKTLLLTTGEYILVDGSSLKDTGIVPDHVVEGEKEQFDTALSLLTGL